MSEKTPLFLITKLAKLFKSERYLKSHKKDIENYVGRGRYSETPLPIESHPLSMKVYDDDGILYYEGTTRAKDSLDCLSVLDWFAWDSGATKVVFYDRSTKAKFYEAYY